ncbi:MAG: outer membrane beta-barrel protein [Flavobacteriaceae bacterium]
MMKNKNIDQLFQDKMEGLEVTPSPKVWSAIEGKLTKKKRRVLPYWWLSGGVAAVLLLGLFVLPSLNDNPIDINNTNTPIITSAPKENTTIKNDSNKQLLKLIPEEKTIIASKKPSDTDMAPKEKATPKETSWKNKVVVADNNTINIKKYNTPPTTEKNTEKEKSTKVVIEKPLEEKKKTIFSINPSDKMVIAEQKKDSVQKKNPFVSKKKDFIAFVNSKDSIKTNEKSLKKWSVSSVFAVLNSSSFSNASPISAELNSSPTKGANTFSYGAKVDYRLNNKWSIRTGAHLQEMSYLTQDVSITSGSARINSQAIDFGNSASAYHFSYSLVDIDNVMSNLVPISSLGATNIANGEIEQSFSYIEVPFEVKYHFNTGEKLKTGIVAGFSSLFLVNNTVEVVMDDSSVLGRANNLNSMNFSGNIGFDIDYSINKNWSLNLNPMFKSQFNTFSGNANGFRPYFIGVYSGVRYQF